MSIWRYGDNVRDPKPYFAARGCVYCQGRLSRLREDLGKRGACKDNHAFDEKTRTTVSVCRRCGWWRAERLVEAGYVDLDGISIGKTRYGAVGALKLLDVSDIRLPIEEARDYLMARYDARFEIHPRVLEEVVASVFKDLGYRTVVTAYSGDNGIDVILERLDETVGVQVKRYRAAIEAEQIRALVGALVLRGLTKGMFVTTSRFRSGAHHSAERAAQCGYPVELVDANRFFEALAISQRNMYRSREDFDADIVLEDMKQISEESSGMPFDID